jgi:hypothetical protein
MMKRTRPAFQFAPEEEAQFEASLGRMDDYLRNVARHNHMSLHSHAGKGWPGRMLQGRRWLKTYSLRISLEPSFVDTGIVRWEIHDIWMYDYGELYRSTISFRQLTEAVEPDQIGSENVCRIIDSAVSAFRQGAIHPM